jgi:hypothetical protein
MKSLVLPIAGQSTRFPNIRPKWMLAHPNGNLMIHESIKGLPLAKFDKVYAVGLKSHFEKYNCEAGLRSQFEKLGIKENFRLIQLEQPTRSQPETVAEAIRREKIEGAIVIKDADNFFEMDYPQANFVGVYNLNDLNVVNAGNKSYVTVDDNGLVNNIAEKQIISSLFCCGAYSFEDARQFLNYYEKLQHHESLYISHIIYKMLLDQIPFKTVEVKNYIDWGTLSEWNTFKGQYSTLFVDLDGTLVKSSAQHFPPYWGQTDGITENIESLNRLYESGKSQIIITTSRTSEFKEATQAQLKRLGIKYHQIIFDLYHSKRIIINDFAKTNPYKSCDAINIKRDSEDLKEMLEESLGFEI